MDWNLVSQTFPLRVNAVVSFVFVFQFRSGFFIFVYERLLLCCFNFYVVTRAGPLKKSFACLWSFISHPCHPPGNTKEEGALDFGFMTRCKFPKKLSCAHYLRILVGPWKPLIDSSVHRFYRVDIRTLPNRNTVYVGLPTASYCTMTENPPEIGMTGYCRRL